LSSKAKPSLWAILLLCGWAFASLGALAYFEQQHYGVYDPDNELLRFNSANAGHELALQGSDVLIAVIDPACYCARAARVHLQQLKQQYPQLVLQELTPAQWRQHGPALPATPAVVWYQRQQLRYAGPLAQGPNCSSDNDVLLPLLLGRQRLAGVWLNSETVACRCLPSAG